MKRYMKNRNQFLQISKQIIYPSRILLFFLVTSLTLFSCDKFLQENPKDKLPEEDVYNTISEVYLNAVASLYTYVGGYSDSQGLQGTGRGVYDLNTFTSDEAIIPTRGGDWYDGGFWLNRHNFRHHCYQEKDESDKNGFSDSNVHGYK